MRFKGSTDVLSNIEHWEVLALRGHASHWRTHEASSETGHSAKSVLSIFRMAQSSAHTLANTNHINEVLTKEEDSGAGVVDVPHTGSGLEPWTKESDFTRWDLWYLVLLLDNFSGSWDLLADALKISRRSLQVVQWDFEAKRCHRRTFAVG